MACMAQYQRLLYIRMQYVCVSCGLGCRGYLNYAFPWDYPESSLLVASTSAPSPPSQAQGVNPLVGVGFCRGGIGVQMVGRPLKSLVSVGVAILAGVTQGVTSSSEEEPSRVGR